MNRNEVYGSWTEHLRNQLIGNSDFIQVKVRPLGKIAQDALRNEWSAIRRTIRCLTGNMKNCRVLALLDIHDSNDCSSRGLA